jgi:hypothetical protein
MIPAIIAVMIPFSGETPEAMANAIAKGSATMPTINPDITSFEIVSLEIPSFSSENNLGINSFFIVFQNNLQRYNVLDIHLLTYMKTNQQVSQFSSGINNKKKMIVL